MPLKYLLMKFETKSGIAFIREQIEKIKGYIIMTKSIMKQAKLLILKTLKE